MSGLCVSFEMLVRMYLSSFASVFTRALAFIAGGINSSPQAGCLCCREMCRQAGALCATLFDISDVGGEKP